MNPTINRAIDKWVGKIICNILGLFVKHTDIQQPKSILIIKLWAVGESILTLPMIAAIKKTHPETKITVITRDCNKAVYEGQSFVDEIIVFELRNTFSIMEKFKQFGLAIDCEPYLNISAILGILLSKKQIGFEHGSRARLYHKTIKYNDQQHVVKTYCDLATLIDVHAHPTKLVPLTYSKTDEENVKNFLTTLNIHRDDTIIGICPTTAETSKDRKWPLQNYANVINQLTQNKTIHIILVGGRNDFEELEQLRNNCRNKKNVHNTAGKTTLKQLFALTKLCSLFISNDTGPMHIAAAQGVRTIGIFGPNLPLRFKPFGKDNIALYEKQECSPCINVHKGEFPKCFNPIKGKCVKAIQPEKVIGVATQCMNR